MAVRTHWQSGDKPFIEPKAMAPRARIGMHLGEEGGEGEAIKREIMKERERKKKRKKERERKRERKKDKR